MKSIIVAIILFFACYNSQGQAKLEKDSATWFFKNLLQEEGQLWTSAFRIKKRNILSWAPVLAATGITIAYDEEIFASVKNFESTNPWVGNASPALSQIGESYTVVGASFLFQLAGHAFKSEKALQTGAFALQALGHMLLISTAAKIAFGRKRPETGGPQDFGKDNWTSVRNGWKKIDFIGGTSADFNSFPSGHTMSAWTFFSVIALQYKETVWVPALCYTIATGVGLSRIVENRHWMGDVVLGAAMGYGIAKYVVANNKGKRITFFPTKWKNAWGLTGIYKL